MKIKSRFKDYYDYVAHLYGGGDERVTYVREPLSDDLTSVLIKGNIAFNSPGLDEHKSQVKWLVINGRVYTIVAVCDELGQCGPYKLFTKENFDEKLLDRISIRYRYRRYLAEDRLAPKWERYFGEKENEIAIELSKIIQHPVFVVESCEHNWDTKTTRIVFGKNIPILSEYGINHHIQPEQLYQDIAYYVSNKMVSSPDLEVHDNMTDKEKIVQHGFDLKQSFRHRK